MALMYMMLLVGAALASCSPIHPALEKVHESIVGPLNLTQAGVGSKPLFTSVISSLNSSCQVDVMLMNATLDVYMRIFDLVLRQNPQSILQQVPSKVKDNVNVLKNHMRRLQKALGHPHLNKDQEDLLSQIQEYQVEDALVQRQALAEFLEVYHAASGLVHPRHRGFSQ